MTLIRNGYRTEILGGLPAGSPRRSAAASAASGYVCPVDDAAESFVVGVVVAPDDVPADHGGLLLVGGVVGAVECEVALAAGGHGYLAALTAPVPVGDDRDAGGDPVGEGGRNPGHEGDSGGRAHAHLGGQDRDEHDIAEAGPGGGRGDKADGPGKGEGP